MRAVVIVSGGLDSVTLLHQAVFQRYDVLALSFHYGQRHFRELGCAAKASYRLGVAHRVVRIPFLGAFGGSALTDSTIEVPEGHYADESMKSTVVPNRNMVMLAIAASFAIAERADALLYGAHAGDHAIYPDCRPEFLSALGAAIGLADWHRVVLDAPFIQKTKAGIVGIGHQLGVRFDDTWSCYKGGAWHCGRCGTCVERREAFVLAGVADPTLYADDKVQS